MTHSSCEEKVSNNHHHKWLLIVIATAYINKSQFIVYVVAPQWHSVDWLTFKEHYFKNLLFQENKKLVFNFYG